MKNINAHQDDAILDVGCGTGAFLNEMKTAGWNITGLEPDKKASKNAAENFTSSKTPNIKATKPILHRGILLWNHVNRIY